MKKGSFRPKETKAGELGSSRKEYQPKIKINEEYLPTKITKKDSRIAEDEDIIKTLEGALNGCYFEDCQKAMQSEHKAKKRRFKRTSKEEGCWMCVSGFLEK
ncbi:hypothetical protein NPIL_328481 [Nephila pilipes]|uniref:Uncharacterized protein n=1 Tax=Nephila pilipes TaxID=299642 RepID=A0A8X6I6Y3_NEPPI|nr:hypothetical protein NPIL_328481 [Nephila pilipes]